MGIRSIAKCYLRCDGIGIPFPSCVRSYDQGEGEHWSTFHFPVNGEYRLPGTRYQILVVGVKKIVVNCQIHHIGMVGMNHVWKAVKIVIVQQNHDIVSGIWWKRHMNCVIRRCSTWPKPFQRQGKVLVPFPCYNKNCVAAKQWPRCLPPSRTSSIINSSRICNCKLIFKAMQLYKQIWITWADEILVSATSAKVCIIQIEIWWNAPFKYETSPSTLLGGVHYDYHQAVDKAL